MIICAADPGKKGALVALDTDSRYCNHIKLSYDKAAELETGPLDWWLACVRPDLVLMEKVGGRAGWGAVQTFNFGDVYGQLRGYLKYRRLPRRMVPPKTWQAFAHAGVGSSGKAKERSLAAISQVFPTCPKLHEGVSDALLMAWFGVSQYGKSARIDWDFKNLI